MASEAVIVAPRPATRNQWGHALRLGWPRRFPHRALSSVRADGGWRGGNCTTPVGPVRSAAAHFRTGPPLQLQPGDEFARRNFITLHEKFRGVDDTPKHLR